MKIPVKNPCSNLNPTPYTLHPTQHPTPCTLKLHIHPIPNLTLTPTLTLTLTLTLNLALLAATHTDAVAGLSPLRGT